MDWSNVIAPALAAVVAAVTARSSRDRYRANLERDVAIYEKLPPRLKDEFESIIAGDMELLSSREFGDDPADLLEATMWALTSSFLTAAFVFFGFFADILTPWKLLSAAMLGLTVPITYQSWRLLYRTLRHKHLDRKYSRVLAGARYFRRENSRLKSVLRQHGEDIDD